MTDTNKVIGITDAGQPIVLPEHTCEHWLPGQSPTLNSRTCWYCRWADFRKRTDLTLPQSVCRCPHNRMGVLGGSENEQLEEQGGERHA